MNSESETVQTPNKSASKKLKKILSACRSSLRGRKGCKKEPGVSYSCAENNFDSRQNNGDNTSCSLESASAEATNSISRELFALSQSSSEENIPNVKRLSSKEVSQAVVLESPEVTLESSEDKPNIKLVDKSAVEKLEPKQLKGYVGFANLPNQIYWKAVKKGFEFTLMVVGQSGLGKSTLINSMFLTDIYNSTDHPGISQRSKRTVSIEETKVALKESGVNLALTVVDTPGFGDAVNNDNSWVPIVKFIESKYEAFLTSENRINRTCISDQRVHCCLYFIQPTGHGLKSLDVEFMRHLHDKVNIVPVIAKADTLTEEECGLFKKQIMREIVENDIKVYEFPDISEEDEEYQLNKSLRDKVPFAVVGSNTLIEMNGRKVRGRKYPWGVVDIENMDQCEFIALRKMVVCTHMQDLKDVTHFVHYENYRCRELLSRPAMNGSYLGNNFNDEINKENLEHGLEIQKMNIQQILDAKIHEQIQQFQSKKADLTKKYETSKRSLEQQSKELDENWRKFRLEKDAWESENL